MKRIGMSMLWGVCALGAGGCGESSRTQVMLVVDADEAVRGGVTSVGVTVAGGESRTSLGEPELVHGAPFEDPMGWPLEIAITPRGNDASREFEVVATASWNDGGTERVAVARVQSGFVTGDTRELRIVLVGSCTAPDATACDTCSAGICDYGFEDPDTLPEWGQGDGGAPDAGEGCASSAECEDDNPCTTDTCTVGGECMRSPAGAVGCDDGDPCTLEDTCNGIECASGLPFECDEGKECTSDGSGSPGCVCASGYRLCAGDCIPEGSCCNDGDCQAGEACPMPGGGCGCPVATPIACQGSCYAECCPGATTKAGCTCQSARMCSGDGTWGPCGLVNPECTPGETMDCNTWEITCQANCRWPVCSAV